jgi:hypothetical protein
MKVGDSVRLKDSWYIRQIERSKNILICGVEYSSTAFYLPIDSWIVKDLTGKYEKNIYEKVFEFPSFVKQECLTDVYNCFYHYSINEKNWIDCRLGNTNIHGQYVTVRAELHPFNKHLNSNVGKLELETDRIAQIVLRRLEQVDENNEILFSSENEITLIRSLRRKQKDENFSSFIKLECCKKVISDTLIEIIMANINQMNFSTMITGKVTHIFNRNDETFVIFCDNENTFCINKSLLVITNDL